VDAALVASFLPAGLQDVLGDLWTPALDDRARAALVGACEGARWTAAALACARHPAPAARARCAGALSPAQVQAAEEALVTEVMLAVAEPLALAALASPRPGAHPEFPTAALAGTAALFSAAAPARGPATPLALAIPRAGLATTLHAHCEADLTAPVCSPASAAAGPRHWRVGRAPQLVVVEELRHGRVDRTVVYRYRPDGAPRSQVSYDAYERVERALWLARGRYSARRRSGANALEGCGLMGYELDPAGRAVATTCLQWGGAPMRDADGVARIRLRRDASGFVIERQHLDPDGRPAPDARGVAVVRYERDADGRIAVERYAGTAGHPAPSASGCHGLRTERASDGTPTALVCLDAAGQPTARPASGLAIERFAIDAAGCRVGVALYDARGGIATNEHRVHRITYDVDARCQVAARTCRGAQGQAAPCEPGGPARYELRYDAVGNAVSIKHYDPGGAPGRDPAFQAFELRRAFDERGNQVSQACYDPGARPVTCPTTGFHRMVSELDDVGRELAQTYFDARGDRTSNFGAYQRTYRYDSYDHLVESTNRDERGAATSAVGVAIRREIYDVAHRRFGMVLLGPDRRPASTDGCFTGATCPARPWHAVRILRRRDGGVEWNLFFDEDRRLVEAKRCAAHPCFD
jgi:hypothetical protein